MHLRNDAQAWGALQHRAALADLPAGAGLAVRRPDAWSNCRPAPLKCRSTRCTRARPDRAGPDRAAPAVAAVRSAAGAGAGHAALAAPARQRLTHGALYALLVLVPLVGLVVQLRPRASRCAGSAWSRCRSWASFDRAAQGTWRKRDRTRSCSTLLAGLVAGACRWPRSGTTTACATARWSRMLPWLDRLDRPKEGLTMRCSPCCCCCSLACRAHGAPTGPRCPAPRWLQPAASRAKRSRAASAKFTPRIRFDPAQAGEPAASTSASTWPAPTPTTTSATRRCAAPSSSIPQAAAGALPGDQVPRARRQPLCRRRHAEPERRQQAGDAGRSPGRRARRPVLAGEATLKRLDFGVGTGEWADTELLPNEVRVHDAPAAGAAP